MKGLRKLFLILSAVFTLIAMGSCKQRIADVCVIDYSSEHGRVPASVSVPLDSTFTEELLAPIACDELIFAGWYIGDEKVKAGDLVEGSAVTLTAKWEAMIVYYSNSKFGNTPSPDYIVVPEGAVLTKEELPTVSAKTECGFTGWSVDGAVIDEYSNYVVTKGITLRACYGASITYKSAIELTGFEKVGESYEKMMKIPVGSIIDDNYIFPVDDEKFVGWTLNGKIISEQDEIKVEGAVELEAAYSDKKHIITFKNEFADDFVYALDDEALILENVEDPKQEGQEFLGWKYPMPPDNIYYADITKTSKAYDDLTVYAKWTDKTVGITFHANNGTEETAVQTYVYDATVTLPANTFTYTGTTGEVYRFLGWSFSKSDVAAEEKKIEFWDEQKTCFREDTDLYAVWDLNRIAPPVADKSSGEVAPGTKIKLSSSSDPDNEHVRIYYSTNGTTPNENSGIRYNAGAGITLENIGSTQVIKAIAYDDGALGLNKSAVSTMSFKVVCKVTYCANVPDGYKCSPNSETVTYGYGEQFDVDKTFESHGLEFLGWSEKDSAKEPSYTDSTTLSVTNNLTLYGVWAIKEFSVSYNKNGYGSYKPASKMVKENYLLTNVDLCRLTSPYAKFKGWTDSLGNPIQVGYSVNRNLTLVAQWEPIKYTITYDCNGLATVPSKTGILPGTTISESMLPVAEAEGYFFAGWQYTYTVNDGETTAEKTSVISASDGVKVNSDITLKAKFYKKYVAGDLIYDTVTNSRDGVTEDKVIAYIFRSATATEPALGVGTTGCSYGYFLQNTDNELAKIIYNNVVGETVGYLKDCKYNKYNNIPLGGSAFGDVTGEDNLRVWCDYIKMAQYKKYGKAASNIIETMTEDTIIGYFPPYQYAKTYGERNNATFSNLEYRKGWYPVSLCELYEIATAKNSAGKTALDYLKTVDPALIYADLGSVSMSTYDGFGSKASHYVHGLHDESYGSSDYECVWKSYEKRSDKTRTFIVRAFTE